VHVDEARRDHAPGRVDLARGARQLGRREVRPDGRDRAVAHRDVAVLRSSAGPVDDLGVADDERTRGVSHSVSWKKLVQLKGA